MESIGRLAGGIAHDFNNMMSIVIGYSDVMTEELRPSDPNLSRITKVRNAACRAAALTRQLLAFGRRQALDPVLMNLNEHISELTEMLKPLLGEDVQLTLSLDKDLWQVHADPVQIDQVLMNLFRQRARCDA